MCDVIYVHKIRVTLINSVFEESAGKCSFAVDVMWENRTGNWHCGKVEMYRHVFDVSRPYVITLQRLQRPSALCRLVQGTTRGRNHKNF